MMAKILIVDDSAIVRDLVEGWLKEAGHAVVAIDGVASFVSTVATQKPDLVLMDVDMPGYPGTKLAELVKKERLAVCPIVLHSSRKANELAGYCLQCGAQGYIEKTHDRPSFVSKVAKFLVDAR
jgi:two-component system chemotaxis response regulator CheY